MKLLINNKFTLITLITITILLGVSSSIVYGELNTSLKTPTQLFPPLLEDSTKPISQTLEEKMAVVEKSIARTKRIESLLTYLKKMGSPVATQHYAELIVDLNTANNADYRVIVAIMGTESTFCKKSFYYNCFGYLNGVKYTSYDHAFNQLVPKISKQYVVKYGWDFEAFVIAYGQHNDHAASNLYSIASKLFY